MMSQNRQETRDRLRAKNDYKINLKAELEIRHLHEKVDHLFRKQSQRVFEIQQIQLELMRDLTDMWGRLGRGGSLVSHSPVGSDNLPEITERESANPVESFKQPAETP